MKDYYKILNVSKNASHEEIKTSYRKLAKKYHPDLYINNPLADLAAEKLKEINEAYDVLGDSQKRDSYDRAYTGNSDNYQSGRNYSNTYENPEQSFFANFANECEELLEMESWYELHRKCNEAKRKYPNSELPYFFEMQAFFKEGNYDYAIESARESMIRSEKHYKVLSFISSCYIEKRQYDEALAYSLEANQMCNGMDADVLARIALIYDLKGDSLNFNSYMNKLKRVAPNHEFIQARQRVYKVGNEYVNKNDAHIAGGCLICSILECFLGGGC